ncbi:MAG TPA: PQQ-dependent catabolism-associated beta-propeller protein [Stellaceae bacterium]|jgi:PQQ-dependent catabolism-associated beta-propeller protein|nr:PQQ-dependent catabolism-associated beta-propeller protein [Stellaceae bacterium]
MKRIFHRPPTPTLPLEGGGGENGVPHISSPLEGEVGWGGPHARYFLVAAAAFLLAAPAFAGTNHLFVSNEKGNGLTVLNATDYTPVTVIKTGARPRGMVFSPDHKLLYVACGGANRIDIVDVASLKVVGRIGHIDDPETFDLDKKGERLFISNEDAGELSIYDLATKKLLNSIKVGLEPEGVLLNADDTKVYVASEGSNLVSVIDVASGKRGDIGTDTRPRRFAMTPDGKELWVSTELAGRVDIIDVATDKVTGHIDFLPPGMRKQDVSPVALVIDRTGTTAFVTLGRANHVGVVDVKKHTVADYILVGARPWGIAFDREQKRLFVANGASDDVSIIDAASRKVLKSVPVGHYPYGVAIDE